jgi:hypothetical protein
MAAFHDVGHRNLCRSGAGAVGCAARSNATRTWRRYLDTDCFRHCPASPDHLATVSPLASRQRARVPIAAPPTSAHRPTPGGPAGIVPAAPIIAKPNLADACSAAGAPPAALQHSRLLWGGMAETERCRPISALIYQNRATVTCPTSQKVVRAAPNGQETARNLHRLACDTQPIAGLRAHTNRE